MKPDPLPPEVPYLSLPLTHRPAQPQPRDWHRLACRLLVLAFIISAGWGLYRHTHQGTKPAAITTP